MRAILILFVLAAYFAIPGTAIGAESFGSLFTTPAERANLDHLRKTTQLPKIVPDQPTGVEADPAAPSPVSVEGYVMRGDGKKGTVWINNSPVLEDSASGEVAVGKLRRNGNQVPIKLPATGKSLNLKAGQVYNPGTDSVSEIGAHASQMANGKAEDSGTIGTNPVDTATETNRR